MIVSTAMDGQSLHSIFKACRSGDLEKVKALYNARDGSNSWGDVPALFIVAIVLWIFMPNKTEIRAEELSRVGNNETATA